MSIVIHGLARSRAIRNIWMAEELGIPYRHVEVPFGPEGTRSAAFLKLNPNGHVPVIEDDGLVLWESLAINLYLAKKHGGPLAPKDVAEDGLVTMWSFWALTEVERHAIDVLYNRVFYPPEQRDETKVTAALEALRAPLHVLEAHLSAHGHLVGKRFTAADLNLACVVFYLRVVPDFLARYPAVKTWYEAAMVRPAAKRAFAKRGD